METTTIIQENLEILEMIPKLEAELIKIEDEVRQAHIDYYTIKWLIKELRASIKIDLN